MKKLLAGLFLTLGLIACGESDKNNSPEDKPVIKIGATLPLSGNSAEHGLSVRKSMELALQKWQNKGTKYHYQLYFEDDQVSPKQGLINANNLINVRHANAILSQWTPVGAVVAPLAEKQKTIHITCSFGDKVLIGDYNFNNYTSLSEQSKTFLQQLQKRSVKKLAFLIANTTGCEEQSSYILEKIKKTNIDITDIEYFNPSERDFRLLIKKINQKNPDLFFLCAISPSTEIFLKQFAKTVGKKKLTTIDAFWEMNRSEIGKAEGLWFVNSASGTTQFSEDFQKQTGQELRSCTANLYDATDILIYAYENTAPRAKNQIPDNEDVVKTIKNVRNYNGAVGEFSVNQNGLFETTASVKLIKDGKYQELKD